jgi:tetratricopeptide (TPR) repeat protein/NAD-dependent dihydropyrimidine dehydrogenase PreA subunit
MIPPAESQTIGLYGRRLRGGGIRFVAGGSTSKGKRQPLPLAGAARVPDDAGSGCPPIRPSRRGRWRALSLVLVHVAAGLHVLHWYFAGRTLTPVEPSEAMQTLGQGMVNAGFVLFALLILSTLIFGRFFCGWGCHVVALQDLCTWLLRRAGIRPRPFRSRLLVGAPLLAAFYMFVAPTLVRLWIGRPRAPLQAHFTTESFWDRFPGWPIATLTFAVCGFLIVYLLGNKGFCTYGCPYGGIFGLADRVAPGKIRVTDACEGCAHCTATCTSNVRVHEEVRLYGMVVNSGCMKCMDCVNVCPKDALYFGFGAPSAAKGAARAPRPPRRHDFTWGEEIALAVLFLGSLIVLTALYEAVPFLLALGLSAISAYVLLTALRATSAKDLRFARFQLRLRGETTRAGALYLLLCALWTGFLIHSGWVRYLTFEGTRRFNAAAAAIQASGGRMTTDARGTLEEARDLLERSERLGWVRVPNLIARLGSVHAYLGDSRKAEQHYRRAVELAPSSPWVRADLARIALARNDREGAIAELREIVRLDPEFPDAHANLADQLVQAGRAAEAARMLEDLLGRRPGSAAIRLTYGVLLARLGEVERARGEVRRVIADRPEEPRAHHTLARIEAAERRFDEALAACRRAVDLDPGFTEAQALCSFISRRIAR